MKLTKQLIILTALLAVSATVAQRAVGEDFGITAIQGSSLVLPGPQMAMRVTLLADGDLQSISAYINAENDADFYVALYADNSGSVGALLSESFVVANVPLAETWRWETIPMPSSALTDPFDASPATPGTLVVEGRTLVARRTISVIAQ